MARLILIFLLIFSQVVNAAYVDQISIVNSNGQPIDGTNPISVKTLGTAVTLTGSGAALNADVIPSTDVSAHSNIYFHITGTFVATVTFQGSNDGVNFVSVNAQTQVNGTTAVVQTANATNGLFRIPVSFRFFRARLTAYTSGTMNASALCSSTPTQDLGNRSVTATVTGTTTANQGTSAAIANSWYTRISDAVDGPVQVLPASTAPAATDVALVTALSPNGNQATAANQATQTSVLNSIDSKLTAPLSVTGSLTGSLGRSWTLSDTTDTVGAVQSGSWGVSLLSGSNTIGSIANTAFGRTWSLLDSTDSVASVQSGTWNVGITNFPSNQTVNGTVTANQGGTWNVGLSAGSNTIGAISNTSFGRTWSLLDSSDSVTSTQGGAWSVGVNNFPANQTVNGTVTAKQGGTWNVGLNAGSNVIGGVTQSGSWTTGRTWSLLNTTDSVNAVQSGNWTSRLQDGAGNPLASFDMDNTGATSYNLGVTLRGLANGTPVELGTGSNPIRVDPTGTTTQPISATSLPLPTGAATSANQATMQTALNTIATNTASAITDTTATGTITALNGAVAVNSEGAYTVSVAITGTWAATLVAEGQTGNNAWIQIPMYIVQTSSPYPQTFTVTTNATVLITGGGYKQIRIRSSAFTSGTVQVDLVASLAQQTISSAQLGTWSATARGTFNTTLPTITNGAQSDLQTDNRGRLLVNTDLQRRTYSASFTNLTAPTAPTDIFTITGSATTTVYVKKIRVTGVATANTFGNLVLIKRSSANTGGTSTTATGVPYDSNDTAATAVVRGYTANPTLGTSVGTMISTKVFWPATGATLPPDYQTVDFEFGSNRRQALILRGNTQVVSVNLNAASIGGLSLNFYVEWEEE